MQNKFSLKERGVGGIMVVLIIRDIACRGYVRYHRLQHLPKISYPQGYCNVICTQASYSGYRHAPRQIAQMDCAPAVSQRGSDTQEEVHIQE